MTQYLVFILDRSQCVCPNPQCSAAWGHEIPVLRTQQGNGQSSLDFKNQCFCHYFCEEIASFHSLNYTLLHFESPAISIYPDHDLGLQLLLLAVHCTTSQQTGNGVQNQMY